jgi:hypothetical protein
VGEEVEGEGEEEVRTQFLQNISINKQ